MAMAQSRQTQLYRRTEEQLPTPIRKGLPLNYLMPVVMQPNITTTFSWYVKAGTATWLRFVRSNGLGGMGTTYGSMSLRSNRQRDERWYRNWRSHQRSFRGRWLV